jgi:hypothetical protein
MFTNLSANLPRLSSGYKNNLSVEENITDKGKGGPGPGTPFTFLS